MKERSMRRLILDIIALENKAAFIDALVERQPWVLLNADGKNASKMDSACLCQSYRFNIVKLTSGREVSTCYVSQLLPFFMHGRFRGRGAHHLIHVQLLSNCNMVVIRIVEFV